MAAGSMPNLDQGPPLPPGVAPPPQQPTMAGLAGQPGPAAGAGSAALTAAVTQKLMFVEQTLQDVATMLPAAAPAISGVIDLMRKGMGAVLAQGAAPPPASPGPGMMMGPAASPGAGLPTG